jgi:hypothetical protein
VPRFAWEQYNEEYPDYWSEYASPNPPSGEATICPPGWVLSAGGMNPYTQCMTLNGGRIDNPGRAWEHYRENGLTTVYSYTSLGDTLADISGLAGACSVGAAAVGIFFPPALTVAGGCATISTFAGGAASFSYFAEGRPKRGFMTAVFTVLGASMPTTFAVADEALETSAAGFFRYFGIEVPEAAAVSAATLERQLRVREFAAELTGELFSNVPLPD